MQTKMLLQHLTAKLLKVIAIVYDNTIILQDNSKFLFTHKYFCCLITCDFVALNK